MPSGERRVADLVSTTYQNRTGPAAVYALVLDVDADRTADKFLDGNGCVDSRCVVEALESHLPVTHYHLTAVCRSTSGRGLHLFFSMVPVVLTESGNSPAETFALRVQRSLVAVANTIGIGADPGAVGLKRLVSNFNNPDKVVFRDSKKRTRIENAAKAHAWSLDERNEMPEPSEPHHALRLIGRECEAFLRQTRRQKRLYPESQSVERGYARFLCFLAGWLPDEMRLKLRQLGLAQGYFKGDSFAPVRLSMAEMATIFEDVSLPTIRRILRSRPELLVQHERGSSLWEVQLLPAFWHELEKAGHLVKSGKLATALCWTSPWELPQPEMVENGFRNQYLVWLMNAYKSRGYSESEALAKIRLRILCCPNAAQSRTVKRLSRKVQNFYKNCPDLLGRYADQPLPTWLEDDAAFSLARGENALSPLRNTEEEKISCSEPPSPKSVGRALVFGRILEGVKEEISQGLSPGLREVGSDLRALGTLPADNATKSQEAFCRLTVVRHRMRVGIFAGDELIFATTNSRHFVVGRAMALLLELPRFQGTTLRFWYPKHTDPRMTHWRSVLEKLESVPSASTLLGTKVTREEALATWSAKRGMERTGAGLRLCAEEWETTPF